MSCQRHSKAYKIGETFTAPRIVISAVTATEAQYADSIVSFRLKNELLGITIAADTIYKTVVLAPISITDAYGGVTNVPEQWTMALTAVIDYAHTSIPAGWYEMRYEVVYPNGVKKFYGELEVMFEE